MKHRWNNEPLLDEEEDLTQGAGGSGGGNESLYDDDSGEENVYDEGEGEGNEEDNSSLPPEKPSGQQFDAQALAQALSSQLAPLIQQKNQPPPKEMTDEEFRTLTKYRQVQKEEVAILLDPEAKIEDKMAALQGLLDGTATHAVNVANLMMRRQAQEIDGRYAPLLSQAQQADMDKFLGKVERFSPSFKGKKQILQTVMQQMAQAGYRSQGEAKDIQNLATYAKKFLQSVDPNFKLTRPVRGGGRAGMPRQAQSVNGAGGGHNGGSRGGQAKGFMTLFPNGK